MEIVLEAVHVDDHQANGLVDNAVKNAQGQFRVIKDALEKRHKRRVGGEHPAAPWMVMHAVSVISRGRKDEEGLARTGGGRGESLLNQFLSSKSVYSMHLRCPRARTSSTRGGKRECGKVFVWRAVNH